NLVAGRGLTLQTLARNRDRGCAARKLALPFTQSIGAAEIGNDLLKHVPEPARPRAVTRSGNMQSTTVAHGTAGAWGALIRGGTGQGPNSPLQSPSKGCRWSLSPGPQHTYNRRFTGSIG